MSHLLSRRLLSAFFLVSAPLAGSVFAGVATWDGSAGNWSDVSHWSTAPYYPNNGTPTGATYDVTIGAGSVNLDVSPTVGDITLGTATLGGSGELSAGYIYVTGDSAFDGDGVITAKGLQLSASSFTIGGTRSLAIPIGTSSWTTTGTTPQVVSLASGSTFTNGGTFTSNAADNSEWNGGAFINNGTFNKNGSTSLIISSEFDNNRDVWANGGNLILNHGTHNGFFGTANGGSITFTGTNSFGPRTWIAGIMHFAGDASFAGSVVEGPLVFDKSATMGYGTYLAANSLTINGKVTLDTGTTVSSTGLLTINGGAGAPTGQLDLRDNTLVIRAKAANKASSIASILDQIATGRDSGTQGPWTGPGITSSTLAADVASGMNTRRVVLADNADLQLTRLGNQGALDSNALILTTAQDGDATLDQKVDAFDLNVLASHWQQPDGALWSAGDFTGDGKVDAFDLNVLAANWQAGAGSSAQSFAAALAAYPALMNAAPVPEPATIALLTPLLLFLRRPKA